MFSSFEFPLTTPSLADFDIYSDGSIFNVYPIITWIITMMLLHLCLHLIIKWCLRIREDGCWKWFVKVFKKVLNKLYSIMTFGFYIRNCFEMSQLILIFSINELFKFNTDGPYRIISITIATLLVLLFFVFIGIIFYLIVSSYKITENSHNKLEEFFKGIKQLKKFRFVNISLLLRKVVYIGLLIWLESAFSKLIIVVLGILSQFEFQLLIFIKLVSVLCIIQLNYTIYSFWNIKTYK